MRLKKGFVAPLIVMFLLASCENKQLSVEQRTFNILQNWDKVGMKNHLNAGSNVGPLNWFTVESLVQYVRSTDEIVYCLAESIEHKADHTSIIHIRPEAKWHNGDDYVADDLVAYYYINQTEVTNYMMAIEALDSKTVKVTWKEQMEPNDNVKTLLFANDRSGSIKYDIFKKYVDRVKEVLFRGKMAPADYTGWAPYGRIASAQDTTDYGNNYAELKSEVNPDWFVGTGPYRIKAQSETEMILEKFPDYWAVDNLKFDFIKATNSMSDLNQIYSMLQMGTIDYQDGLAPIDTLNTIINTNPQMSHYKMFDPGAIGLVFNTEAKKPYGPNGSKVKIWTDEVREAFEYILDREEIKNSGNPYAETSYHSMMSMAPSEAKVYMSKENFDRLPVYSHDENKAAELLRKAGWEKKNDNYWYLNGNKIQLIMNYDGSHPGQSGAAIATQAALEKFGIECVLKRSSDFNSWLGLASSAAFAGDMSMCWTDLNMSFSFPKGSFTYCYTDISSKVMQLPKFEADDPDLPSKEYVGKFKLKFPHANGQGEFYVSDVLNGFYCLKDEELTARVDDLVLGLANMNYGVQIYQNVTGSFFNIGKVGGLPKQELLAQNRNMTYVPSRETDVEDFYRFGRLNFHYAYAAPFILGDLYPNAK